MLKALYLGVALMLTAAGCSGGSSPVLPTNATSQGNTKSVKPMDNFGEILVAPTAPPATRVHRLDNFGEILNKSKP